jgi:hypothetical protein
MNELAQWLETVRMAFDWLVHNKDALGVPALLVGLITLAAGGLRYFFRQRDAYRFLSQFFPDPRRASRE